MSTVEKNKLAAQILKAEMLGDSDKVIRLKAQMASLKEQPPKQIFASQQAQPRDTRPTSSAIKTTNAFSSSRSGAGSLPEGKARKFLNSTSSLSDMFAQEKSLSASDEAKMYLKTSAKFSRDDMETKYFSQEIDDSQLILNKSKRLKAETSDPHTVRPKTKPDLPELCANCIDRQPKHLVIDERELTFMALLNAKPFLSSVSNVVIRNNNHAYNSFIESSQDHQDEVEKMVDSLREMWKSKGYRCLIMETHFRNLRLDKKKFISCGGHFQVHCLPIKEKHFEKSRMHFKQALMDCEKEWSLNKKLIMTDHRRIQRYIPKGLAYFWVCFDDLKNGFGHVIEDEREFSRFFGLEVLSGLLDKDFNPMKLDERELYSDQFERSRLFKLDYSKNR